MTLKSGQLARFLNLKRLLLLALRKILIFKPFFTLSLSSLLDNPSL